MMRAAPCAVLGLLLAAATAAGTPVTSPPAPQSPWDGWYLGAHAGFGREGTTTSLSDPTPQSSSGAFGSLYGGGLIGYSVQLRSRLVLGGEADVSFPNFIEGDDLVSSRQTASGTFAERIDAVGRVRGRVGYAFDRWLLYGAGGFAWSAGRFTQSPGTAKAEDDRLHVRPGWTLGAGVAHAIAPGWTARLEYLYDRLGGASATFPSGARTASTLDLHSVRLGLERQLRWLEAEAPGAAPGEAGAGDRRDWSIHGQLTYVEQGYFSFHSPYAGANSLSGSSQVRNTFSATLFLGRRLWPGAEVYFNPELMQGFGLDDVHGVAAFPNGEAQKSSFEVPRFNAARLFVSQTFNLGGERETVLDGPNQLAGARSVSRITVTVGKFAVTDYFLVNPYAGEPRTGFLNWNVYGGGAYDWTMDKLSWTWGGLVELNQRRWALRAGYFLLPEVSNSNHFDLHVPTRGQWTTEVELRFAPFARPGKLRLFGWLNHGNMGSYADALAEPGATAGYPDLAPTRRERINYGFVASAEQAVTDDLGVFSRLSWNPGHVEIMGWTDCDESFSLGAALRGTAWKRPHDTVGVGWVIEGLSPVSRQYFAAGGLGILIGDGRLNYRPESVLEVYYAYSPIRWAAITLDYQLVVDPGYNADRGPASIFSLRLHAAF
jgi:high affinity Mn2+ porin